MLHVLTTSVKQEKALRQMELEMGGKTGADLEKLMQDMTLRKKFRQAGSFTYEADIRTILNGFRIRWVHGRWGGITGGQAPSSSGQDALGKTKSLGTGRADQPLGYWDHRRKFRENYHSPIIAGPFSLSATTGIS